MTLLDETAAVLRSSDIPAGFAALKERWPDADLHLVHDEEAYDVLIREPGGTLSIAYSPAPSMPWPERGAVRYSDQDLARIDGRKLRVSEALSALDFLWYDHDVLARLVDTCLIHAELERDPVDLSDEEVQTAADAYRRARGLLDPASTERWLNERGLSHDDFTALVTNIAEVARLRARIGGGFDEWLADARAAASIEWFWLARERTVNAQ
ncbi:hypothetical protein KOI35_40800 [Actinoplanes bogorensis]|uniref:Nucleotidyltransferase AbiEii toxin of type IV toxin-antitoxin system n=1 Tax=Paractinoplanes bogorensis TaxID=1610840 RepID=A0ABS5Z2E4_9ACTN|nr:hypothetical protein [Actinoplanes bogorensis]MBU2669869.1 hypothetical protein [Actinoplanes bogorensis]